MGPKAKRKKQKVVKPETPPYLLVPFLLVLCLVPLIVYLKVLPLSGTLEVWTGQSKIVDLFSYYKAFALVFLAVIAGAGLAYLVISKRQRLVPAKLQYGLLGSYVLLAGLSAWFADYRDVAFGGFLERYEGFWVLFAYGLVLFVGMNVARNEKALRTLLVGLVISATLISLLGLSQFIGHDFLASAMGRKLILPKQYESSITNLQFNFGEGTIYGTLYNTNYVGSYMVLVIPVALALLAVAKERKERLIWGAAALLCTLTLLGSNSRAGYVALVAVLLVFAALQWRAAYKHWKISLAVVACGLLLLTVMNFATSGWIFERVGSMLKELTPGRSSSLQSVELDGTSAKLTFREEILQVAALEGGLALSDEAGNRLVLVPGDDDRLYFTDERYEEFSVDAGGGLLEIQRKGIVLRFGVNDQGLYLSDRMGEPLSDEPVEAWGFEGREALGNSRGYIWSRTIPLIKDTLLLGHGPDTFAFHFPQHDYLGKARFLGDMNRVVDKPHNMYLQTAVQTGLLSLLALLGIVGLYVVDSLRLYAGKPWNGLLRAGGMACFLGVVGYMVAGVFNDSVVSVAPVFWGLMGLGIGVNHLVKQEMAGN